MKKVGGGGGGATAEGSAWRCEARKNISAFAFELAGLALVAPMCFALPVKKNLNLRIQVRQSISSLLCKC